MQLQLEEDAVAMGTPRHKVKPKPESDGATERLGEALDKFWGEFGAPPATENA